MLRLRKFTVLLTCLAGIGLVSPGAAQDAPKKEANPFFLADVQTRETLGAVDLLGSPHVLNLVGTGFRHWGQARERVDNPFLFGGNQRREVLEAGQLFGTGNPLGAALVSFRLWGEVPEKAVKSAPAPDDPRVDRDLLVGIEDKAPVRSPRENYEESRAYNYLVARAHQVPAAALAKAARRDLSYVHLFEEPHRYRGEIVHIYGRMKRFIKFPAPEVLNNDGITDIYEGWIFQESYGANPVCVLVTDPDPNLPTGDSVNVWVDFDGWFFKRYRYRTSEPGRVMRDCPLLIGRTVTTAEPPEGAGPDLTDRMTRSLVPTLLVTFVSLVGLGLALTWWFRRGDHMVRRRVAEVRPSELVLPPSDVQQQRDEPGATEETPM